MKTKIIKFINDVDIFCLEQPDPSIGMEFIKCDDLFDDDVVSYSFQIYLWKYRVVFYMEFAHKE